MERSGDAYATSVGSGLYILNESFFFIYDHTTSSCWKHVH